MTTFNLSMAVALLFTIVLGLYFFFPVAGAVWYPLAEVFFNTLLHHSAILQEGPNEHWLHTVIDGVLSAFLFAGGITVIGACAVTTPFAPAIILATIWRKTFVRV